jgi:hypothetical protein
MSTKKIRSNTKTSIVIVSRTGTLSECVVEPNDDTTLEQLTVLLSKKCGYRNHDGFSCYHTWRYKNKKNFAFVVSNEPEPVIPKYMYIDIWAKTDGRAGNENKYEMPPPIDELIFFGNIALVARIDKETAVDLTVNIWYVIYEKLFGGFEDLAATAVEDENEIDELDGVPKHKKTSNGYLKDGFIVEDDDDDSDDKKTRKSKGRNGSKKNKSESTESEFITETETETDSLSPSSSDSPAVSDADADADADDVVHTSKQTATNTKKITETKPKRKQTAHNKKVTEEQLSSLESETELTEEEYV